MLSVYGRNTLGSLGHPFVCLVVSSSTILLEVIALLTMASWFSSASNLVVQAPSGETAGAQTPAYTLRRHNAHVQASRDYGVRSPCNGGCLDDSSRLSRVPRHRGWDLGRDWAGQDLLWGSVSGQGLGQHLGLD